MNDRFSSVQFSHSVVSDTLWPHEPRHARPPCPSSTPEVYSNPCPLSRWRHPTISSSVNPFSSCLQSFPASGSFQMSQRFSSSGQSIGMMVLFLIAHMRFHWFGLLPLHTHSSLSAYATVSYQLLMKEYSTIWLHTEVLTFGSIEICQHIQVNTSNTEFKLFPPNGLSSQVSYLLEHPHYLFVLWSLESWRVCPFLHFSHPCLPLGIRRLHLPAGSCPSTPLFSGSPGTVLV